MIERGFEVCWLARVYGCGGRLNTLIMLMNVMGTLTIFSLGRNDCMSYVFNTENNQEFIAHVGTNLGFSADGDGG